MRFLILVLDYDNFKVFRDKNTDEYFVLNHLDNGNYEWKQIELNGVVVNCDDYTDEELARYYESDFCGEDVNFNVYLYFKIKE